MTYSVKDTKAERVLESASRGDILLLDSATNILSSQPINTFCSNQGIVSNEIHNNISTWTSPPPPPPQQQLQPPQYQQPRMQPKMPCSYS